MRGVKYAVLKNPGDLTDRQSEAFGNLVFRQIEVDVFGG